jgi:hypothetical protein
MSSIEDKVLRDSRGNLSYLLLAELIHNQVALFGVKIQAATYEQGIQDLIRYMNDEGGRRFIEAQDMQTLITVRIIQCPGCGNLTPASSPECVHCRLSMKSPEVIAAIQKGKLRVIQQVEYRLKALGDGTENTYRIRPEHIVLYDIVPPDSPAYRKWVETAEEAKAQLRELRTGITMPTGDQVAILEQERLKRPQRQ